jgi:hypothetical protein
MKCDDVLMNLPDYILGMVEPNLKKSIDSHLEACSKCKGELAEMGRAISVLGRIEVEEYPDGFWRELRTSIMEQVADSRPSRWKVPAFAGGLAIFLVVIGIGVYEYALKPVQQVTSITTLAASLPSEQVVELPNLNINYVNSTVQPIDETEEINSVDDSVQLAVVKSMWGSVADSSKSFDDFDYTGDVFSN